MHRLTLWALFFLLLSTMPAAAVTGNWQEEKHARVRLLIDPTRQQGEQPTVMGGLHFQMQEGWKNYWRSPGAAGLPPRLTLQAAENVEAVEVLFPVPTRFVEPWGLETFGYKGEVLYPVAIRVRDAYQPVKLRATLDYMVCAEICVPYTVALAADFTVGDAVDEGLRQQLQQAEAQLPRRGEGDVRLLGFGTATEKGKPVLKAAYQWQGAAGGFPEEVDLFVEGPNGIGFPKPTVQFSEGRQRANFTIPYEISFQDQKLEGETLHLTFVAGHATGREDRELTVAGWQEPAASSRSGADAAVGDSLATGGPAEGGLWLMLGFAFLGGLILNIMPCVLPVLSLKLIGVMKQAGAARSQVRASFLASAAGIILSFLLLAAIAAALQQAGMAVGWGMHFQEPLFVLLMAVVMALFAANLWGWFEVQVGGRVTETVMTTIDEAEASHHHWGHFVSGIFATLLATPCSAPFLGTAIGFALSGTLLHLFLIFGVMGLGLAAPYLLVAAFPSCARLLPKPGRWMLKVKWVFGGLLLLTALWLLWVVYGQLGLWPSLIAVLLMADVLGVLYLKHRGHFARLHGGAVLALVGMTALLAVAVPLAVAKWMPASNLKREQHADYWQPFEEARIAGLVAEGKTVFVDVTADWCVTCKANKFLVLDKPEIQPLMTAPNLVAMQADWTNHDASIGAYLKKYNRYGIPFNIVYGPGAPEGIPLPEFLTHEAVEAALVKAGK